MGSRCRIAAQRHTGNRRQRCELHPHPAHQRLRVEPAALMQQFCPTTTMSDIAQWCLRCEYRSADARKRVQQCHSGEAINTAALLP